MKLLFMDRHCPGHFPITARWFASQAEHKVIFLSDFRRKQFNEPRMIHRTVRLPKKLPKGTGANHILAMTTLRAKAYAAAMRKLKDDGFTPDYICHGAASCCALYAKDIYPDVPQLGIFDWYHQAPGREEQDYTADALSIESFGGLHVHNLFQLTMIESCNVICTPSIWQRNSYPAQWREQMHVLHPGVDTEYFAPETETMPADTLHIKGQPLSGKCITFLTRLLTPESGFGDLYRLLPQIFAQDANCQFIFSGRAMPEKDGSKSYMEHVFQDHAVDTNRLHHMYFSTAEEYRRVLRASSVYVHMPLATAPPDRGLLEAMSCGCLVVVAETPPLRALLQDKHNALLVTPPYAGNMVQMVTDALNETMPHIRQQARKDIINHYDAKTNLQIFLKLLSTHS